MAKLSKGDWLEEGFKILSEYNQAKIRILYLCERLKVTRGSFYHHFESIESYIEELMEAWEEQNTLALIRISKREVTGRARMMALNQEVEKADQRIEAAIRSWSFYNDIVRKHLAKVDQIRLTYLETIFLEMGYKKQIAVGKAKLEYALLVGVQQLFPEISEEQIQELWGIYVGD
ncbi:MAG: TetR/AcrR family transcriptional regulator [Bacteroidia bacterium]|nr:TetR/AcrR family transcriptional regulator [Bacteroidia bacterium]